MRSMLLCLILSFFILTEAAEPDALYALIDGKEATAAAVLCLLQVFSMRWNIVVGGQLLSKSLRGLRSHYEPEVFGREGVLAAIVLVITPFVHARASSA